MPNLAFSIGKLKHGTVYVGVLQNCTVRYDGDAQEFRGGDYQDPIEIQIGNKVTEITAELGVFDTTVSDTYLTDGVPLDLTFETGANSGGLSGTVTNVKCVNFEKAQSQRGFVAVNLTFRRQESDES